MRYIVLIKYNVPNEEGLRVCIRVQMQLTYLIKMLTSYELIYVYVKQCN